MSLAQMKAVRATIEAEMKTLPEKRKAAIDAILKGSGREAPKQYFRGVEDAYKHVLEILEIVSKEIH